MAVDTNLVGSNLDAGGNVKVALTNTTAYVGKMRMMSENDSGTVRTIAGALLKSPETSLDYRLRTGSDVVLMDLKMPGIDGDEVLSLLKSLEPSPKVIFVTAYDDGGKTKARLLKMGACACLDKPISSLRDLEEIINKAYKG